MHVEVIESLDTSSCVNALWRFFALRGQAKKFLSGRGTNFIGASKELGMDKTVLKGPRLQLGIQPTSCLPHGRLLGAHDQHRTENSGL